MPESLLSYMEFAAETAYEAGKATLGYFRTQMQTELKADDSPVTVADRRAEELIRIRIESRYPSHAIVGEEFGANDNRGASHRWFIDPIDGTRSFVRGVPLYAVLVGLEIEGSVEVGVAYFPALDEMLVAASGEGCWCNGRRARVSSVATLGQAVAVFSDPADFARHGRSEEWERVKNAVDYCRGWCDAYGYLLVATGRVELALDPVMKVWDCGPYPPILREAGGYFGDWQGNSTIYGGESVGTTQLLLNQVLAVISEVK